VTKVVVSRAEGSVANKNSVRHAHNSIGVTYGNSSMGISAHTIRTGTLQRVEIASISWNDEVKILTDTEDVWINTNLREDLEAV